MNGRKIFLLTLGLTLALLGGSCSDKGSPTQPPPPPGPQLTVSSSSAIVTVGTSQNITVSGGTPPYGIQSAPAPIATAQLLNPDSLIATLKITGVTVASTSTSVTVKDNSTPTAKTATIGIQVH